MMQNVLFSSSKMEFWRKKKAVGVSELSDQICWGGDKFAPNFPNKGMSGYYCILVTFLQNFLWVQIFCGSVKWSFLKSEGSLFPDHAQSHAVCKQNIDVAAA